MRLELEQFGTSDSLTLDESDMADEGLTATLNHTAIGSLQGTLTGRRSVEEYAQRQGRLTLFTDSDDPVFTGVVIDVTSDKRSATTQLQAAGLGKLLEEDSPDNIPVVYENIALQNAIRDYWNTYTRFNNVSVTDETPETVASGQLIYEASTNSEFQNLLSLADTVPATIQNDNVELLQASFTVEAESYDREVGNELFGTGNRFSNGEAINFATNSWEVEWDFTVDYDIPAGDFGIYYRNEGDDTNGFVPSVNWYLDGNFIGDTNQRLQLNWAEVYDATDESPPEITAGQHTVRAENAEDGSGGSRFIDVVAPLDDRFSWTFDNDATDDGFLDGPELFPDAQAITFPTETVGFNVSAAELTTSWGDTSNKQRISVSNDGGATYLTKDNASTFSTSFPDPGRQPKSRVRLSRYGSRATATPQTGILGQKLQSLEFRVDLNDLTVIDRLELSRDHFQNLKTLHNYGSFLWVFDYDDSAVADVPVFSFPRGAETRSLPSAALNRQNERVEAATAQYGNEVVLQGSIDDQTGDRPVATATDTQAVSDDGRTIRLTLRDPTISTDGGAVFRANALLDRIQEEQALRGRITTLPTFATPGFARPVSFLDGPERELTVESVRTRLSDGGLESELDFVPRRGLNERINELQRNLRDTGNQV